MPAPDLETQSLIRRVTSATKSGKLEWEARSSTSFVLATPAAEIQVWSEDEDGDHPYTVRVVNTQGWVLGSGDTIPGQGYADWEDEIAALFAAARNSALGIKKTYEELAKELGLPDDDIPF